MIDPATGWFEMREIKTKSADSVANVLEQAWLTRYPWPTRMIFDRGSEFKAELCQIIKNDYGVKVKPITTQNPQANAIVERVHQTIGNMIRTFALYDNDGIDDDDLPMVRHPRRSNGCRAQYIFNNNAGNADAACLWSRCDYQY